MWNRYGKCLTFIAYVSLVLLAAVYPALGQTQAKRVNLGLPVLGDGQLPPLVLRGEPEPVRNVILLVGDGTGIAQRTLTRIVMGGANNPLPSELMWEVGLANTHSANALVTDSAAAATQLATGYWTNNGMLSVRPEGERVETILELARELGKATGLVATSEITHATPAAFAAHETDRGDQTDVAVWMLKNRVDVLIGGGRSQFLPRSELGSRTDGRNILSEFEFAGWKVFDNMESVKKDSSPRILALISKAQLAYAEYRGDTLADMTEEALKRLADRLGMP